MVGKIMLFCARKSPSIHSELLTGADYVITGLRSYALKSWSQMVSTVDDIIASYFQWDLFGGPHEMVWRRTNVDKHWSSR